MNGVWDQAEKPSYRQLVTVLPGDFNPYNKPDSKTCKNPINPYFDVEKEQKKRGRPRVRARPVKIHLSDVTNLDDVECDNNLSRGGSNDNGNGDTNNILVGNNNTDNVIENQNIVEDVNNEEAENNATITSLNTRTNARSVNTIDLSTFDFDEPSIPPTFIPQPPERRRHGIISTIRRQQGDSKGDDSKIPSSTSSHTDDVTDLDTLNMYESGNYEDWHNMESEIAEKKRRLNQDNMKTACKKSKTVPYDIIIDNNNNNSDDMPDAAELNMFHESLNDTNIWNKLSPFD